MPTEESPAQLFRNAAALIERALIGLNVAYRPCKECGNKHWINTRDARAYERATDLPTKLNHLADSLETPRKGTRV